MLTQNGSIFIITLLKEAFADEVSFKKSAYLNEKIEILTYVRLSSKVYICLDFYNLFFLPNGVLLKKCSAYERKSLQNQLQQ